MEMSFNNIPGSLRTPGAYAEVDNSRALKGLVQNPHLVLMIGQKLSTGTVPVDILKSITAEGLSDGFFGQGSELARACNRFKANNPNTEIHAIALSTDGGVKATGLLKLGSGLSATKDTATYLLIDGQKAYTTLASGWSVTDFCSAVVTKVTANKSLPVTAKISASALGSDHVVFEAKNSGTLGNQIDIRMNYYVGQENPEGWSNEDIAIQKMSGGSIDPDIGDAWAVIENRQYHYILSPYSDADNLAELETELANRFKPLEDLQGHGIVSMRATHAECTTVGNSRNSPHVTLHGVYDSPSGPGEWTGALGASISRSLNLDPARPLHTLELQGILAPPHVSRFSRSERDILLFDGIATNIYDASSRVLIERMITTYQTNALGSPDPSYLDIETLATLGEIRYQYKIRMVNRFIVPRLKLASDNYPVVPGSKTVTSRTVKQEIIALFTELRQKGLIENLDDFIKNLVVQRNSSDTSRVDVLLPPDLVNQFRVLATVIQFIL